MITWERMLELDQISRDLSTACKNRDEKAIAALANKLSVFMTIVKAEEPRWSKAEAATSAGTGRLFQSKFGGTCKDCGEPYEQGDLVRWLGRAKVWAASARTARPATARAAACPRGTLSKTPRGGVNQRAAPV